jgi:aryl-alcohol dehydrogenase-like predicted oxidoreductase
VTSTIVGARRPGQISETAQAADWELSSNELERIEKAYTNFLVKVG